MYAVFECVLTLFHHMCMDVKMILRTDIGVRTLQKAHTHMYVRMYMVIMCNLLHMCVSSAETTWCKCASTFFMLCFTPEALLFAQGLDSV